jgi:3',5'-cyclic AMP phosphodiesterase CpdA
MSRLLLHLSDLHFGRVPEGMADALVAVSQEIAPDVVIVSGDLTQRAKAEEFEQARAFLDRLPGPQIVIPGNHDVPLYNPYGRFVERLTRFRRYITEDLAPAYVDAEVAVFGINTARSLTWKNGRINARQIETVRALLCEAGPDVMRVVATHHPSDIATEALASWAACGADLLLCGHLHIGATAIEGGTLVVNAGTAISTRGRGQANSFNVIRVEGRERAGVTQWAWDGSAFAKLEAVEFERDRDCWRVQR